MALAAFLRSAFISNIHETKLNALLGSKFIQILLHEVDFSREFLNRLTNILIIIFYELEPIVTAGEFKQLRPLPIGDQDTNKALEDLFEACAELRRSVPELSLCYRAGPLSAMLVKIRLALLSNLRNAYKNGVRSILRGYLYDLQPRDFLA